MRRPDGRLALILGALPTTEGERDIHIPGNASLTLSGLTISGGRGSENEAYSLGGGIYAVGTGTLTLEGVVVSNNVAMGGKASFAEGGGIAMGAGRLVVHNSALINNTAEVPGYGGAISIGGEATTADLTNVTIAANSATSRGGGIDSGTQGLVMLDFVTIMGNQSENQGGGIGGAGGVRIRDTIIDGNTAPILPEHTKPIGPNCDEAPISDGGNVADPACGLSHVSDAPVFDPMVGPLEGSPIPVLEPLAGSPALDRAVGICPVTDARGVARPQGAACDSGAAERPVPPSGNTGSPMPILSPILQATSPTLSALALHSSSVLPDLGRGASIAARHKRQRGTTVSYRDSQAATTAFVIFSSHKGFRVGSRCLAKRPRARPSCTWTAA